MVVTIVAVAPVATAVAMEVEEATEVVTVVEEEATIVVVEEAETSTSLDLARTSWASMVICAPIPEWSRSCSTPTRARLRESTSTE